MRTVLGVALAAVMCTAGSQAHAAWYRASSKHFVIYADESPKELSDFANRLERFDQAVRYVRGMDDPPVGDGNRLTVFVLPNVGAVQKLMGGDQWVEGFYSGRASGSYAFVPRYAGENAPGQLTADTIFFHEYSHHLMMQVIDKPLPEWVVEGFAEFMSTARFDKDGSIGIGTPAYHRAWGLVMGHHIPLETMLGGNYSKLSNEEREASIYSRGWLLVHYLTFEKSRQGQLDDYANRIARGVPALDAARSVFGDLKQLDKELNQYLNRSQMTYLRLPGSKFQAGTIDVRPLSEGSSKIMMLRVQSKRGVNQTTAEPLAVKVREVEARYPGDELVELTLAEAEIDAGHIDASEAAADRVLKANPKNTRAMVFKARAIAARSEKLNGAERHAGFERARSLLIAANKIDTEDPEPLMLYYRMFASEGISPTQNAIAALHYASDLAPQDMGLRMNSALQYLRDGKTAEAKRVLTVIAYNPHGQQITQFARTIIEKIDAGDAKDALAAAMREASSTSTSQ